MTTDSALFLAVEVDEALLPLPRAELEPLLAKAFAEAGLGGAVSLALIDDAAMRIVNRDYHDCDAATDVLAFALRDPGMPQIPGAFDFEIVVSVETAARESRARGVDASAELLLYVVHGALHLLGYDDHDPEMARTMHARTLEVLGALGYENSIEVES